MNNKGSYDFEGKVLPENGGGSEMVTVAVNGDRGGRENKGAKYADTSGKDIKAKDKDEKDTDKEKEKKDANGPLVGFFEVFKFADCLDIVMMVIGMLAAIGHGSAFPLMIIVFGRMIDLFVDSGTQERIFDFLETQGFLDAVNLTKADVTANPSLLDPYSANVTSLLAESEADVAKALTNALLSTMQTYAIYFIGIGVGVLILGYGQVTCWMIASERQTHRIRKQCYSNILRQDVGWFDVQESGELNSRITNDISKIHDGIGDKVGMFLQWFCAFLAGVVIGFIYSWRLTLVILSVSPLLAGSAFIMNKLIAMASGAELKAYAQAGAVAEEVLGAIRTVVAFGGQNKECERYNNNLFKARDLGIRKSLINGAAMGIVWLIIFGTYALGFWYGGKLVQETDLTVGDVMICFFAVLIGAFSLGNAAPNLQSFAVARGAAYVIFELIKREPTIDTYSTSGEMLENLQGTIEFRNIHFRYPSRSEVKVLHGVTLEVRRGQTVALVGASGCGKSTMVQLIQRFYDAEQGQILIDGHDIKNVNLKSLRSHIGIVSQEPVLFGTTIAENIRYGRLDVTDKEIREAAAMANAHDFIEQLPDKYETLVGERGAQLSGGQKQRVAIARALVRDPKILLLDEATSALDTESEGVVQDALEKASHGRTTIVIAHRLSTIKTADKIAGFKDGLIVEQGTHEELMSKGGIYQQLVKQQTNITEDDLEVEEFVHKDLERQQSVVHSPLKTALSVDNTEKDEEKKKKEAANAGFIRILKFNAEEWLSIAVGGFASLLNGGVMPVFAVLFAEIIGVFAKEPKEQEDGIRFYSLLFMGLGIISFFTNFTASFLFGRAGEYLTLRLRSHSFKALLRQEIAFFDDHNNSVGALTTRLATDAAQVQGAAGPRLGMTLMSLSSILTGVIIAFIYSWKLTLVVLCFFPLLVIGGALQMKMLNGAAGKNKEALEAAGKIAVESIENIRTVASLTREDMFQAKFQQELGTPYREALKKAHLVGLGFSSSQAAIFFCYGASFWYGAYLIEQGEINFVDVFKAFSAVVFGGMAVGQASSFAPDAAKGQTSAVEIFKLLDREPTIDSESPEGEQPIDSAFSSRVQFSNVKFHYPTRPDVKVLQGLNLSIEPGQTVALVGSSGCGKSTTVQLIERFYDADDGQVIFGTYQTTDLNIQWLRSQIGIVSQEPVLFDRTIRENIAYGDNFRDVPDAEVIAAARKANIHEFIASLPEGYDTNAGEKGSQLSGGQKQRIAIARALVRNPRILLLDEATSALDTESEKVVQEALDKAREGRTCIVIAHRLSTIQNADKICVLRHGVVSEQGTHSELMKNQGFYYKLNMVQARKK